MSVIFRTIILAAARLTQHGNDAFTQRLHHACCYSVCSTLANGRTLCYGALIAFSLYYFVRSTPSSSFAFKCSSRFLLDVFAFGVMSFNFTDVPPGLDLTESRTASNNAIGIVLFVLSLIFVGLRLFVRLRMKREPLGLDDYLMFLGQALNAGNLACCIAGGFYGLGKHIWSLDEYQMRKITIVRIRRWFCDAHDANMRRLRLRMSSYMHGVCALSSFRFWRCIEESLGFRGWDTFAWA
jgi:hypothetical protein